MSKKAMRRSPTSRNERRQAIVAKQAESPWKTLSRELWDADHGDGDYDERLRQAKETRRAADH